MGKTNYIPLENVGCIISKYCTRRKAITETQGRYKIYQMSQTLRRGETFRNISKVDLCIRNPMCHCFSNAEIFHNIKNCRHVPLSKCTLEKSLEENTV